MHFGEYELSPSLISLSPPPSVHPEAFQRLSDQGTSGPTAQPKGEADGSTGYYSCTTIKGDVETQK